MLGMLARNWWVVGLRGLAALFFGLLALILPGVTLFLLVLLFGGYVLADGILALITAFLGTSGYQSKIWQILIGLVSIAAGIFTFAWPGITALVLLYIIAFWALVVGVIAIITGIQLRKELNEEWLLLLEGAAVLVLGLLLLLNPGAGAVALIRVIGAFALLISMPLLILAFRLRSVQGTVTAQRGLASTDGAV